MYSYFILLFNLPTLIISKLLWVAENRTVLTNNKLITIQSMRFKKTPFPYYGKNPLISKSGKSKRQCAEICMDDEQCISWSSDGDLCLCYSISFLAGQQATTNTFSDEWSSFEVMNPCTENLNLCEHGSTCAPDRLNKTYECLLCLAPYTGLHCNETGPPTPPTVSQDILDGKNSSCRTLKKYYDISVHKTIQTIYPWRDQRNITVVCHGDRMTVTKITNSNSEIRDLSDIDLVDGLDLTNGLFRAKASFLNNLQKLIYFDKIYFRCSQTNGGATYSFVNRIVNDLVNYRQAKYFTGDNYWKPVVTHWAWVPNSLGYTWDPEDGKLSTRSSVLKEDRPFKNVVIGNDGKHFTFSDDQPKQCFGNVWDWFKIEVV
ncbi:uncharacterized protein [Clytia hemisphaerica]|uniref:EGF-like domain-containing protein n=2 Tax=Clytia hemisphaerica TaxID=252671 RepID=A0A7M5UYG2_9CNID